MRFKTMLLAAAALALLTTTVASAAGEDLVFILDASNSMNKILAVDTRIDAAREALAEILGGMPDGRNIGLMVYGHRINYENEVESCQDLQFLFPTESFDQSIAADMIEAIGQLEAQGKTPLADSLSMAADALVALGNGGAIVLISDGEGNCGGQQQVVAEMIATLSPEVVVHVVGLDVEADAYDTLYAIAETTGGGYWDVGEAADLLAALTEAVGTSTDTTTATAVASDVPPNYACMGITNVIYGTDGDDVIYGTEAGDLIYGLSGDDFLIGLDGNDVLIGGPGNDILEGIAGCDLLDGGEGDDVLFGGADNDILCGGVGNDSLEGEGGNDVLDGGSGCDALIGGAGDNTLYCSDGLDVLYQGTIVSTAFTACPVCLGVCPATAEPCYPDVTEPVCTNVEPEQTTLSCASTTPVECSTQGIVKCIDEGSSLQLHGSATDGDCNIAQVYWDVSAGSLSDPTSLDPVFCAPMIDGCSDLEVQVTLTAVDTCGASACDSFVLLVRNVNHAPTVDAGDAVCINEGDVLALHPTIADADGDALCVQWTVGGGIGVIDTTTASYTAYVAPMISACDGVDVPLTIQVTDPCGATACDTIMVHIRNVNAAPIVDLGPDFALDEGCVIRMTPVVSDPECETLRYCWTITGGAIDSAYVQNPTFAAPLTENCDGVCVTLTLTVTDPCGLSATDSVNIMVRNVNHAPTVELGEDLCVIEGGTLHLMPHTVDADGDALSYLWCVTGGAVDNMCSPDPVFCAPLTTVCEGIDITVTVTVKDQCGLSATDSIVIHVQNVNQPPSVTADP